MRRGEIWWATLPEPEGSEPGYRRPVLVVQANSFNRSSLRTVLVVALTTHLDRAEAPGNVLLSARRTGLPRDSVANVSQLASMDRSNLTERIGELPPRLLRRVEDGLRRILALGPSDVLDSRL